MKTKKINEIADGALRMDGFDDCVVGMVERFNQEPILCYSVDLIIAKLMKNMSEAEAWEYYLFNQIGAWLGEKTPCFIRDVDKKTVNKIKE
jgi:hypothetical protein